MFPPCTLFVLRSVWPDYPSPCELDHCSECCESTLYPVNRTLEARYLTAEKIRAMFVTDPVERMAIEIHDTI